jgi:hypothetical protein
MGVFLHAIIIGDFHKLKQVIRNIISNALKFTREGGSVTVTLTLEKNSYFNSSTTTTMMSTKNEKNRFEKTSITIDSPYISLNDGENMNNSFVEKYYIKLSVEDSGPGISEVHVDSIVNTIQFMYRMMIIIHYINNHYHHHHNMYFLLLLLLYHHHSYDYHHHHDHKKAYSSSLSSSSLISINIIIIIIFIT